MTREPRTSTGQWFWRGNAVKGSEAQLARTLCAIEDEAQSMRWPAASPSRDTEIERIAAVLRRANWPIDGHGRYGAVPSGQVKDAASRLYSAGLRSQPASEPSLDVERREHAAIVHDEWHAVFGGSCSDGIAARLDVPRVLRWLVETRRGTLVDAPEEIAAEYARLSQPADNEAAE